ncbi:MULTISPECIES: hypothetical protein [Brachybacterium]|uniref:Uncharacterized protein n=2 Tax=Brachybacterium TaxID=43668 RepID=A0A3R8RXS2_9MICO|nr:MULTISPECIES: hypothetical protein [Brachybacterium]RRR18267.1 hypothetical protein DS079_11010 [Brachybacterium paraconglomeratum]GLI30374.1 hypothetical protein BCONGLO52_12150 [Brachybacterium conglomeratum]GLK04912.1 hypothetical protein GCM10017597_17120 [Brachybacterium conglomeratum]
MTTLYRPVLIESAEQAEALPVGTIALLGPERPEAFENAAAVKVGPEETSEGVPLWLVHSQGTADDARMVGWTALVPIEAEEQTQIDPQVFAELDARIAYTQAAYALPPGDLQVRHVKRLVTPWEER